MAEGRHQVLVSGAPPEREGCRAEVVLADILPLEVDLAFSNRDVQTLCRVKCLWGRKTQVCFCNRKFLNSFAVKLAKACAGLTFELHRKKTFSMTRKHCARLISDLDAAKDDKGKINVLGDDVVQIGSDLEGRHHPPPVCNRRA